MYKLIKILAKNSQNVSLPIFRQGGHFVFYNCNVHFWLFVCFLKAYTDNTTQPDKSQYHKQ